MADVPADGDARNLTVSDAVARLAAFNCVEVAPALEAAERSPLREAVRCVAEAADYVMFGVCADSLAAGLAALTDYATALGCAPTQEPEQRGDRPITDGVYLKFNPSRQLFYAEPYEGEHRGVLVACQSYNPEGLSGMYGHLPLDLFAS